MATKTTSKTPTKKVSVATPEVEEEKVVEEAPEVEEDAKKEAPEMDLSLSNLNKLARKTYSENND